MKQPKVEQKSGLAQPAIDIISRVILGKKIKTMGSFVFSLFLTLTVQGQQNTWIGGAPGQPTNWDRKANWSLGEIPTASNIVIIPGNTTNQPTLVGSASCLSLVIYDGGSVNLDTSTLTLVGDLTLQCGGATGTLISGTTGTLSLGGNVTVTNATNGTTGATISSRLALGTSVTRIFTVADDGTIASDLVISGTISGTSSGIAKTGVGTMVLSGASNNYSGLTTINEGTLKLGSAGGDTNSPLGTPTTGTIVNTGASLDLNGFTLGKTEPLTLNGTGVSGQGALINSSTTSATYSGSITLASSSSIGVNGNITVTSIISGANALTKVGNGTLILSGSNTFTGGLVINSGTVQLGNNNSLADVLPVTLNGGTFNTAGYNEAVGTLTLTSSSTIALGATSHSLYFSNSSSTTWTGILSITGWTGTAGSSGATGKIFVGNSTSGLTPTQLAKINFEGYEPGSQILSNGEVVPRMISTGDYQSRQNGSWSELLTWEKWDGEKWIPLTSLEGPPTNVGPGVITTILGNHTVTVLGSLDVFSGQVVVKSTGSVIVNNDGFLSATTINNSGTFTIQPDGQSTVGSLTNYGTLNLNSTADGTASLILDSYADYGTENIQLYLSGGGSIGTYPWHYISSPVSGIDEYDFFDENDEDWDLAHFVENINPSAFGSSPVPPYSLQMSWVGYDGWSYYDLTTTGLPSFSSMEIGKGYLFWDEESKSYTLSGTINTNRTTQAITSTNRGDILLQGYNLLGNPFTCGLSIEYLFDNEWPGDTYETVWFTKNSQPYVYSNGVMTPDDGNTGFIPPMQGFFVKTDAAGTFTFPLGARAHTSVINYKKGGDETSISLIRLSISENGKSDETVIRFDKSATSGADYNFDAPRFMAPEDNPGIYTTINGQDFTINGLPFPESSVEIPLVVNLLKSGIHTINTLEIEKLDDYRVILKDKAANSTVDLRSVKEYSFNSTAGLIKDRFTLTVTNMTTGIEDPVKPADAFNIYSGFDLINIQPLSDEWDGKTGMVKVLDFSGRPVRYQNNTEFNKNSLLQIPAPEKGGLYFVEIRSGLMKFVGKVVVK
jgi:autotransporter-associated beta strand protein